MENNEFQELLEQFGKVLGQIGNAGQSHVQRGKWVSPSQRGSN